MSALTNEWGQPFADYELRAIRSGYTGDWPQAASLLGFNVEDFEHKEPQAVMCWTCGALFGWCGPTVWLAHRDKCGWPKPFGLDEAPQAPVVAPQETK